MHKIFSCLLIVAGLAASEAAAAPSNDKSTTGLDGFRRLIVTGDGLGALRAIEEIPPQLRSPKEDNIHECVRLRLHGNRDPIIPEVMEARPAVERIIRAYQKYWRASLSGAPARDARGTLLAELNSALPRSGSDWDQASLDDTSSQVKAYLEGLGLHAITGVTRPFYELIVWSDETKHDYSVNLSDQTVEVSVTFLDGFGARGWLHYATCEWFGAGGWTANGRLFAIAGSYDLGSETFRVSYLGHEGRHLADNKVYPNLDQPELEYRAKLTELVLSRETTRKLLLRFIMSGHPGRVAPHAHAEYWLAHDLQLRLFPDSPREPADEDWQTISDTKVRDVAAALLAESAMKANKTLTRFLPN